MHEMIASCGLVFIACPTVAATQNFKERKKPKAAAGYRKSYGFGLKQIAQRTFSFLIFNEIATSAVRNPVSTAVSLTQESGATAFQRNRRYTDWDSGDTIAGS